MSLPTWPSLLQTWHSWQPLQRGAFVALMLMFGIIFLSYRSEDFRTAIESFVKTAMVAVLYTVVALIFALLVWGLLAQKGVLPPVSF